MIDRGLIERVPGPGRAVHHRLTDKGRQLRTSGSEVAGRVLVRTLGALTPTQLSTFDELLLRILDAPTKS
jgi:DNA-binding MarR family transcriptional regulator